MRSDKYPFRFYVECSCSSREHLLVFDVFDEGMLKEEEMDLVEVFFTGNYYAPWYKRIWIALKFVFFRAPMCVSDSVTIEPHNIDQLEKIVNYLSKRKLEEIDIDRNIIKKRLADIGFDGDDWDINDKYTYNTIINLIEKIELLKVKDIINIDNI